jgi:hypothetical protein
MRPANRGAYFVPVIVFGLFMAGCGGPAGGGQTNTDKPGTSTPPTSATTPGGVVRGQVLRPPGPDPRSGGDTKTVPVNGDPVHANDSTGNVVASTVTGPDGHFEFTLAPGTYLLTEDTCGVSQQVDIRGGQTTSLNLAITNAC